MYVSKVKIHKDMVPDFFKKGFNSIVIKGIPEDAKILDIEFSKLDNCFHYRFQHNSPAVDKLTDAFPTVEVVAEKVLDRIDVLKKKFDDPTTNGIIDEMFKDLV